MPGRPPAFVASRLGRVTPRNADDHLAVALARGRGLIWAVRAAEKSHDCALSDRWESRTTPSSRRLQAISSPRSWGDKHGKGD